MNPCCINDAVLLNQRRGLLLRRPPVFSTSPLVAPVEEYSSSLSVSPSTTSAYRRTPANNSGKNVSAQGHWGGGDLVIVFIDAVGHPVNIYQVALPTVEFSQ